MIVINILGISWLIIHYNDFINILNEILKDKKKVILIPKKIMSCLMCTSFWVGIILTSGAIGVAGFISLIAYLIDKYLISTPIKL
jgi:hypothetical protein